MLEAGIVGLPAAGKTTLFNVLTRAGVGPDFGKEHVGMAPIADERLGQLAAVVSAAKVTPAARASPTCPAPGRSCLATCAALTRWWQSSAASRLEPIRRATWSGSSSSCS